MIKIAYIISHLENTGPVNILYGIIKNLDFSIFEPYIITLKKEKDNSREEEFKKLGVKIIKCYMSNIDILLKKDNKIKKIIEENKIKIIHTHCMASAILASNLRKIFIYKISTIHCDILTDFCFNYGKIMGRLYGFLYKNALKKIDISISCGKGVKNLNQAHLKIDSLYIMNGIDSDKINLQNIVISKNEIKEELKLEQDKKIFITVSSIDDRKNVIFLARVFKEKLKNNYLIIIGDGNKKEELNKLLKNSRNVLYLGKKNLQEVQKYLKMSDYYISASQSEGMPNSVLEALQFELPVILSDITPHREIININKNVGFIFKNNNEEDLIKKIKKILSLDINKDNFAILKEKISAKRMAVDYMKIYMKLIKKGV